MTEVNNFILQESEKTQADFDEKKSVDITHLKTDKEQDNPILKSRRPSLTKMMSNLFGPKEPKISPVTPKGKSPRNANKNKFDFSDHQLSKNLIANSALVAADESSQIRGLGGPASEISKISVPNNNEINDTQKDCDEVSGFNIQSFSSSSEYQDLLDSMVLAMEPKSNTKANSHVTKKNIESKETKSTASDDDDGDSVFESDADSDTTFEESSVSASENEELDEEDQELSTKYVELTNAGKPLNIELRLKPLRLDIDDGVEKISRTFASQSYKFTESGWSVVLYFFNISCDCEITMFV